MLIPHEQNYMDKDIFRSESSKLIVNTLERSFGHCRAFHDMTDPFTDQEYNTEFINMVRIFWLDYMHDKSTQWTFDMLGPILYSIIWATVISGDS